MDTGAVAGLDAAIAVDIQTARNAGLCQIHVDAAIVRIDGRPHINIRTIFAGMAHINALALRLQRFGPQNARNEDIHAARRIARRPRTRRHSREIGTRLRLRGDNGNGPPLGLVAGAANAGDAALQGNANQPLALGVDIDAAATGFDVAFHGNQDMRGIQRIARRATTALATTDIDAVVVVSGTSRYVTGHIDSDQARTVLIDFDAIRSGLHIAQHGESDKTGIAATILQIDGVVGGAAQAGARFHGSRGHTKIAITLIFHLDAFKPADDFAGRLDVNIAGTRIILDIKAITPATNGALTIKIQARRVVVGGQLESAAGGGCAVHAIARIVE